MKNESENNGIKFKPFRPLDIVVYSVVLLLVFLLFLFFIILPKTDATKGFTISLDGQKILEFEFDKGITKTHEFIGKIETIEKDNETIIKVFVNSDYTEFNEIKVSLLDKTVDVIESNCSSRKDCVHSPKIDENGGIIACMPHGLKIVSFGSEYIPLSTGGAL